MDEVRAFIDEGQALEMTLEAKTRLLGDQVETEEEWLEQCMGNFKELISMLVKKEPNNPEQTQQQEAFNAEIYVEKREEELEDIKKGLRKLLKTTIPDREEERRSHSNQQGFRGDKQLKARLDAEVKAAVDVLSNNIAAAPDKLRG